MTEGTGRKRALRRDVRVAREAMSILMPLSRQIGPWQACAARLVALGERHLAHGRYDPEAEREAIELVETVIGQRAQLVRQAEKLSVEGARSSRIVDMLKALDVLAASLARARLLLAPSSEAPPATPIAERQPSAPQSPRATH